MDPPFANNYITENSNDPVFFVVTWQKSFKICKGEAARFTTTQTLNEQNTCQGQHHRLAKKAIFSHLDGDNPIKET